MIKRLVRTAQFGIAIFLFLQVCLAQPAPPPPKPTVNISFSKPVIREDDHVSVEVLFTSEGEDVTQATLRIISLPSFVTVTDKSCDAQAVAGTQSPVTEYALEPRQSGNVAPINNVRSRSICFSTGSGELRVGDYNVLFVVDYQWVSKGETKQSLVSSEKILKVNFFGSDSVAGVPFALAGLIVPGLFFWLTLRLFGVSWGIDLALGDKLIYSVIISLGFIGVAFVFKSFTSVGFLSYLDISDGISARKLVSLGLTGIAVGFLVVIIYKIVRYRQRLNETDRKIYKDDVAEDCFRKLLRRHPVYNPSSWRKFVSALIKENEPDWEIKIVAKAGPTFVGALGAQESDFTVLVGWYAIKCPATHPERAQLQALERKRHLYKLFAKARSLELPIEMSDSIKQKAGSVETATAVDVMTWNNDEVTQITPFRKERRNLCLSIDVV